MSVDSPIQVVQQHDLASLPPFEELYTQYHVRVYRYFYARLKDEHDAADLMQQVFFQAWKQGQSYEPGRGSVATWLFSIAHHRLVDFYRVSRSSVPFDSVSESAGSDDSPEARLMSEDTIELVNKLLATLLQPEQELLALRFGAGLSSAEIGTIVGKSEAATKKQLTRLLHRLREAYYRQELETPLPDLLEPALSVFIAVVVRLYEVHLPDSNAEDIHQRLLAQTRIGSA